MSNTFLKLLIDWHNEHRCQLEDYGITEEMAEDLIARIGGSIQPLETVSSNPDENREYWARELETIRQLSRGKGCAYGDIDFAVCPFVAARARRITAGLRDL